MKKYFKHKIQNLLVIDKLVIVQFFEFGKNFKSGPESHNFWEMVYVDKECLICNVDGKDMLLKQGQIIFHKPNEIHAHSSNGPNTPEIFVASFACRSEAMRFFEHKIIKLTPRQIQYIYSIIKLAKQTFDIQYDDPNLTKMQLLPRPILGGEQLIKNHIELLLIDLMRTLTETAYGNKIFLTENQQDNKLVDDIIKLLKDNVYNNLSVYEISKMTSYSKAYIFKQFKSATGKGVIEYFNELKNKAAKKLLRENELSVKEISEKLCFDTPNYFSKTFKKLNGITPTQYKKRYSIKLG